MPFHRLAEMTWPEVEALRPRRPTAVLPIGAVEAHGPHLPLLTDGIIAGAMAEAGGELLAAEGREVLLLPPVDYVAAPFASSFAGTVSLRPETVTAVLVDLARSTAGWGVGLLALAGAHLDPTHIGSIRAAMRTIEEEGILPVVFPDVTRKPWALRLTDEFRSGACHAGRYEGSIVLAARPDLVREELARELPENPASLSVAIREGRSSFEEAGGPDAYFGDPAAATAEEGRATIAVLGEILAEAVREAWERLPVSLGDLDEDGGPA